MAKQFKEFLSDHGIFHIQSSTYNPTGNSISERINQTIARVIRMNKSLPLIKITPKIEMALQLSYHRSINSSPHELVYKWSPLDPLRRISDFSLEKANEKPRSQAFKDQISRNKCRDINYNYEIGDVVLLKKNVRSKYDDFWEGPFKIDEINIYKNLFTLVNDYKKLKANIKQLKPFFQGGGETVVPPLTIA